MRKTRGILVGAVVLGLMAIGASSASALTVSPSGAITAKDQGPAVFETKSLLTCPEATYKGTMSAAGVGEFEKAGIAMTGCHIHMGAPAFPAGYDEAVTMQPLSSWNLKFTAPTASKYEFTVSNELLRFALAGAPSCAFYIGGSWSVPIGTTMGIGRVSGVAYAPSSLATTKLTVTQVSECAKSLNLASLGEVVKVRSGVGIQFGTPFALTP